MSLFNDSAVCKMAFEKNELKEYLCGDGKYAEPADRYSDKPDVDIPTRMSCINDYYGEVQDVNVIERFKKTLIELCGTDIDKLQISVAYVMAHLQLENNDVATFKLDDKDFFDKLRVQIVNCVNRGEESKNNDEELMEMLDIQNDYISSHTGYSIK